MSLCLFLESINGTLSVKAPEITIQPGDPCSVMFIASVKRGTHHFDIASEGCLTPVSGFGLTPIAAVEDLVGSINKHAAKGGEVCHCFARKRTRTPLPASVELDESIKYSLK